jgi:hypothetical protein
MYDICKICGALYDTLAQADHYAWHASHGEFPPGDEPDPETTPEEGT